MKKLIFTVLLLANHSFSMNHSPKNSPRRQIKSLPVGSGAGLGAQLQHAILDRIGKASGEFAISAIKGVVQQGVDGQIGGVRFQLSDATESGLRRSSSHDALTPRTLQHQQIQPRVPALQLPPTQAAGEKDVKKEKKGSKRGSRKGSGSDKDPCKSSGSKYEQNILELEKDIAELLIKVGPCGECGDYLKAQTLIAEKKKDLRFYNCKRLEGLRDCLKVLADKKYSLPQKAEITFETLADSLPEEAKKLEDNGITMPELKVLVGAAGVGFLSGATAMKLCSIQ